MAEPLLRCEKLEVGYGGRAVLPPISLEVRPGEFWAVIGRNGSGKSTWFKTVLGMLSPVRGELWRSPGLKMGYVPQRSAFDEMYPLTGCEVVAQALDRGWSFLRPRSLHRHDEVHHAVELVGAEAFADRPFRSLSEGQKQRILLARLVVAKAQVAFLDEPTAAMDPVAEEEALAQVDRIRQEQGTAVLVVSHNLNVARQHAHRAIYLDKEQIAVGTPNEIFSLPVFQTRYAEALD